MRIVTNESTFRGRELCNGDEFRVARCLAGNPPANIDYDQRLVAQLSEFVPELAAARELATTFRTLLTEHQLEQLAPCLEQAASSSSVEFKAIAASLLHDRVAVELAAGT